jgi:hypothetical protein
MNGRRAAIGLCMACALLVCAVAASGAQAAATAHKCTNAGAETEGKSKFSDARCEVKNEGGKFFHALLSAPQELTGIAGTQFEGKQTLKATINAINTELQTRKVTGTGTISTNNGTKVAGTGTITYIGVEVIAPAGKGCKVYEDNGGVKGTEGKVVTNTLAAETESTTSLLFKPNGATPLASFFLDGCAGTEALSSLNKKYEVTGEVTGAVEGAEVSTTHAAVTTENKLKLNGSIKAGLNGSITTAIIEAITLT